MKQDRIARVNRLVQESLAQAIALVRDPRVRAPAVLSVTAVRTSPDLRSSRVYLAISGPAAEQQAALEGLRSAGGFLRAELGQAVRLRYLPELHFFLDDTIEHASRIEQILRELASEGSQSVERQPEQEGEHPDEEDGSP